MGPLSVTPRRVCFGWKGDRPAGEKPEGRKRQKSCQVFFLGFALHAGEIWKGDIVVADTEELGEMDASELHARRLNAKEVLTPMKGDNFCFPGRRWNSYKSLEEIDV